MLNNDSRLPHAYYLRCYAQRGGDIMACGGKKSTPKKGGKKGK